MSENESHDALKAKSDRRSFLGNFFKAAAGAVTLTTPFRPGTENTVAAVEKEERIGNWGEIANPGHEGDMTRGIFFFAGPPNPNSPYPQLDTVVDWDSDQNIEKIFDEVKGANVNVINLSWWGDDGETEKWGPTINTSEINKRVFKEASDRDMMVAPVIEVSNDFKFYRDFPDDTQGFEERIESLIESYGDNANWLQMFDKNKEKRHFIRLVETIHEKPIDPQKFAEAFDAVSDRIYQKTGKKVIFGIDPTPLPPGGPEYGPDEKELSKLNSVVISPYNIFSKGGSEDERIKEADQILKHWTDSGIPVILPLITGFDDTGTDRPVTQKFGNSELWRSKISGLYQKYSDKVKGVSFDSWNTLTEGGADAPTVEFGNVNYRFMQDVLNSPSLNPNRILKLIKRGVVPSVASDGN